MPKRAILAAVILLIFPVSAQARAHDHAVSGMVPGPPAPDASPQEAGQSAFAAIAEMVDLLEKDPRTDWSRISIDALRRHLVDMDNVTLHARVASAVIPGGARFIVEGDGPVRESILRMVGSHAVMSHADQGLHIVVEEAPSGATLTVTGADASAAQKIRALGFFGILALGAHHQRHHLMMARGDM